MLGSTYQESLLTLLLFLILAAVLLYAAKKDYISKKSLYIKITKIIFPILLVLTILRCFLFDVVSLLDRDMEPNLFKNDKVIINRMVYGLKFPFSNVNFISFSEVERGDIICFINPNTNNLEIKRVVGLPKDRISYTSDGRLIVNRKKVLQAYYTQALLRNKYNIPKLFTYSLEAIIKDGDNYNSHLYRVMYKQGVGRDIKEYTVPENHYYVIGDNRDNSNDSRNYDFISKSNIVGKAQYLLGHWGKNMNNSSWYNPLSWYYFMGERSFVNAEPQFRLNFDIATRFAKTGEEFTLGVYDNGGKLIGRYKNKFNPEDGITTFSFKPTKEYKVKEIIKVETSDSENSLDKNS